MARLETRMTVLLPAGLFYWNGTSSPARGGTPFLVARRFGALSCGRGALAALHRGVGWATGRPVENHRGAESTLHVFPCDSSQRRKSFILTRCSTAGWLTRTFNSVTPSPISSTQMPPRRISSDCATASYSGSAVGPAGVDMRDPEIVKSELMEIGAIADDTLKFERII